MATKWKWNECALWDSDGCQPDPKHHAQLMDKFRKTTGIDGYWFFDSTNADFEDDDPQGWVWDDYHNEYRYAEDVGPSVDEIDWAGLDEALQAEQDDVD